MFLVWTYLFGIVTAIWKEDKPNYVKVFILGLFFGLIIEILQYVLPTNRSPELYDLIADTLGSALAIIFLIPSLNKLLDD